MSSSRNEKCPLLALQSIQGCSFKYTKEYVTGPVIYAHKVVKGAMSSDEPEAVTAPGSPQIQNYYDEHPNELERNANMNKCCATGCGVCIAPFAYTIGGVVSVFGLFTGLVRDAVTCCSPKIEADQEVSKQFRNVLFLAKLKCPLFY